MKPETFQHEFVAEHPTALELREAAERQLAAQQAEQCTYTDPSDFEAILEAYARDPERWDGLE
jgi:hypothetical protein